MSTDMSSTVKELCRNQVSDSLESKRKGLTNEEGTFHISEESELRYINILHSEENPTNKDGEDNNIKRVHESELKPEKSTKRQAKDRRILTVSGSAETSSLEQQMHINNKSEKQFVCPKCLKSFPHKWRLNQHEKKHQRLYDCDLCGASCSTFASLKDHKLIHSGERPHLCHLCGLRFTQSSTLGTHIRMFHNREKRFVCKFCSKSLSSITSLTVHESLHTGIRECKFGCHFCGKRFTSSSHLTRHLRTHTGERPYGCPNCDKCFSARRTLMQHIRTHTGEKPFQCRFCDKRCSKKYNLKIHEKIHTKEKPAKD